MTTMGASSFSQFVMSFFGGLLITIIVRLWAQPFISNQIEELPRYLMIFRRRIRGHKRLSREQKGKEELLWRKVNEELMLEKEGVGALLESFGNYAIDCVGMLLAPVTYACLQMFYNENQIAFGYQILTYQIIYYIAFAVIIIPFQLCCDNLLFNCLELIFGWKLYDYLAYQRYRFSVREHRWVLRNEIYDESLAEEFQSLDLLCFSSQFYFVMSMVGFGLVQIVMGCETILRQSYNPFTDPAFLLLLLIVFACGWLIERVLFFLADIPIRRIGWRGLWATKLIEGTVDDEIAAKLAIGESRQADLEQERLELQALNSERFRHRFLERNRPWILQHLVDLLTPRTLDAPGPDGRPTIEYVRDVYAELISMGEGMKKAGDRPDISSDEEDDLEAARRKWPRTPLVGASLAIARLWLGKARKRRAFSKLIKGIIESSRKLNCDICQRSEESSGPYGRNNVRLCAYLSTQGEPDNTAIDRLIAGFESQFGENELDPNLWKAYFRAHAEYCTRCSVCEEGNADQTQPQAVVDNSTRLTRPTDISSDESDDEINFEPIVVSRKSPEGRMMTKWLIAARRKLGGKFPRENAKKEMDQYTKKLKNLKEMNAKKNKKMLKNGHKGATLPDKDKEFTLFSAATKLMARRWILLARESLENKFRARTEELKDETEKVLKEMKEEDDWYFGAALRLEGRDLQNLGRELEADRNTYEAEASLKINKIKKDLQVYVTERGMEVDRGRRAHEGVLTQGRDRLSLDIDLRQRELEKNKEIRRKELMVEEKRVKEELGEISLDLSRNAYFVR